MISRTARRRDDAGNQSGAENQTGEHLLHVALIDNLS